MMNKKIKELSNNIKIEILNTKIILCFLSKWTLPFILSNLDNIGTKSKNE